MKSVTKRTGETIELVADFSLRAARRRVRRRSYAAGAVVQPTIPNGHFYEARTAGQTSDRNRLSWPLAGDIKDGTVTWRRTSNGPTLSSVTWVAPPRLTLSTPTDAGFTARTLLAGGIAGTKQLVEARATLSDGRVLSEVFEVTVA